MRRNSLEIFAEPSTIKVEVLASSDLFEKYLDCVPFFIESWNAIALQDSVLYVPHVYLIAEVIPEALVQFSDYITLLPPNGLPTAFLAQVCRLFAPRSSHMDFVMTSDIDMIPLNIDFETRMFRDLKERENSFVILRDVLLPGQYPMCYNMANPASWGKLFSRSYNEPTIWENCAKYFVNKGGTASYSGEHGGVGWNFDQELLWKSIEEGGHGLEIIKVSDRTSKHHRLDRNVHRGFLKWIALGLVAVGYFHDYHVHHPVKNHNKYLNAVMKIRELSAFMRIRKKVLGKVLHTNFDFMKRVMTN